MLCLPDSSLASALIINRMLVRTLIMERIWALTGLRRWSCGGCAVTHHTESGMMNNSQPCNVTGQEDVLGSVQDSDSTSGCAGRSCWLLDLATSSTEGRQTSDVIVSRL